MYKSIMLSNNERTPQVIRNAMLKLGIEGNPDSYTLSQILPDRGKCCIPFWCRALVKNPLLYLFGFLVSAFIPNHLSFRDAASAERECLLCSEYSVQSQFYSSQQEGKEGAATCATVSDEIIQEVARQHVRSLVFASMACHPTLSPPNQGASRYKSKFSTKTRDPRVLSSSASMDPPQCKRAALTMSIRHRRRLFVVLHVAFDLKVVQKATWQGHSTSNRHHFHDVLFSILTGPYQTVPLNSARTRWSYPLPSRFILQAQSDRISD